MADPSGRRRARVILWVWALASVLSLAYAGILLATSVPAAGTVAADLAQGDASPVRPGERLLVVPVQDPRGDVVTLAEADAGDRTFGAGGDVVAFEPNATEAPSVPLADEGSRFARALVLVQRNTTGGANATAWDVPALGLANVTHVNLTGVPVVVNGTLERVNATFNLTALAGDGGFLVKRDRDDPANATLVPVHAVVGRAMRAVGTFALYGAMGMSLVGAMLPLGLLAFTHTVGGRGSGDVGACMQCRASLDAALAFCPRCGVER